jgi:hypothetical protein
MSWSGPADMGAAAEASETADVRRDTASGSAEAPHVRRGSAEVCAAGAEAVCAAESAGAM